MNAVADREAFWIPHAQSPARYRLAASEAACIGIPGRRAPMGGVTTAAAIHAMEHHTGKPLIWASSQFVSAAPTDTDFDIHVEVLGGSERRPQAKATLAHNGRPIVIVSGALGADEGTGQSFLEAESVPHPLECQPLAAPAEIAEGGLLEQFERRLAFQDERAGRQSLWFRSVDGHPTSAGLLAVITDFVAGAHSHTRGSIGLDNVVRMVSRAQSDWILADIRIDHVGERIFHGGMRLFSETGQLLAISSLSAVRPRTVQP